MNILNINCWKFEDCEPDLQEKIINKRRFWEVDYEWWESTYDWAKEQAEEIGIRDFDIEGFDLGPDYYINFKGDLNFSDLMQWMERKRAQKRAQPTLYGFAKENFDDIDRILTNAKVYRFWPLLKNADIEIGADCQDTWSNIYEDYTVIRTKKKAEYEIENYKNWDNVEKLFDQWADICYEVLQDFGNYILKLLNKEYDYLTSDEYWEQRLTNDDYAYDNDGEEIDKYKTIDDVIQHTKAESLRFQIIPENSIQTIGASYWDICDHKPSQLTIMLYTEYPDYDLVQYNKEINCHEKLAQSILHYANRTLF